MRTREGRRESEPSTRKPRSWPGSTAGSKTASVREGVSFPGCRRTGVDHHSKGKRRSTHVKVAEADLAGRAAAGGLHLKDIAQEGRTRRRRRRGVCPTFQRPDSVRNVSVRSGPRGDLACSRTSTRGRQRSINQLQCVMYAQRCVRCGPLQVMERTRRDCHSRRHAGEGEGL